MDQMHTQSYASESRFTGGLLGLIGILGIDGFQIVFYKFPVFPALDLKVHPEIPPQQGCRQQQS